MKLRHQHRRPRAGRTDIEHIDAALLREMGLNADDLRDAFAGRSLSALFTPFRDLGKR